MWVWVSRYSAFSVYKQQRLHLRRTSWNPTVELLVQTLLRHFDGHSGCLRHGFARSFRSARRDAVTYWRKKTPQQRDAPSLAAVELKENFLNQERGFFPS